MKKKIFPILVLISFIGLPFVFAQESSGKDELYIRAVFQASKEGEPLKELVKNDVNAELSDLGDIVITDDGYEYIIKVFVDRKRETAGTGMSFVVLTATVTDAVSKEGEARYSVSKTGAMYKLRELCKELVANIDSECLKGKYRPRPKEISRQMKIDRALARKRIEAALQLGREPTPAIDKDAVESLSRQLRATGEIDRELTEAEKEVIYRHPDKARRMAEITYYAKIKAKEVHRLNPSVPEDAYRHVLWSYLLAKEFGPELAKEVTDAHEVGATGNTPAEKRMDLRNNAVGTRYALKGYSEESILDRIMRDPDVVRFPR